MSLSLAEFHIRKRLPRRSSILLFDAACLLGWTTTKDIAELADVSASRAKVELAELVRNGFLSKETQGHQARGHRVRFTARVTGIGPDPGRARTGIGPDPGSGIAGDPGSDPHSSNTRVSALDLIQDCKIRPSGGGVGETDARTDSGSDVRESDVQWVKRTWADYNVTGHIARAKLEQLKGFGLTREERRAYLTAVLAVVPSLGKVEYPLGALCTWEERVEPWITRYRAAHAPRARQVHPRRTESHEVSKVSASEMEAFVRSKLKGKRR